MGQFAGETKRTVHLGRSCPLFVRRNAPTLELRTR